jgi:Chaperone for flagella basal body P-ring formation
MHNKMSSPVNYLPLLSLLAGAAAAASAQAPCDNAKRTVADNYHVTQVQPDLVLGHPWVMMANCAHPEWPAVLRPATGSEPVKPVARETQVARYSAPATPLVRAGDTVHVWRQENLLRIEVTGVSEESGELGKTIRVRLLIRNAQDQAEQRQSFLGIVRGAANVEMLP